MPVLYVSSIVYLLLAIGISFNITKGDQKPEKPEKQRRLYARTDLQYIIPPFLIQSICRNVVQLKSRCANCLLSNYREPPFFEIVSLLNQ